MLGTRQALYDDVERSTALGCASVRQCPPSVTQQSRGLLDQSNWMRGHTDRRLREIEAIYRGRFPYFVQVAGAIVGDAERSVEAVQDGFASAIQGRAAFRGDGPLEAWVWRAVLNAARKAARRPLIEVGRETEEARLADTEARKSLGLLLDGLDACDRGCARAFAAEAGERLDRCRLSLEDRLHRPVRPVAYPAGDGASLCRPRDGEPERDALNAPVHDDSAPDSQPLQATETAFAAR